MRGIPDCRDSLGMKVQRVLLPPRCVLCDDQGQTDPLLDLCSACERDLPSLTGSCNTCAAQLPGSSCVCPDCLKTPPAFDRVIAPYRYRWPVDQLLLAFKFGGRLAYGRVLATLLARSCLANDAGFCQDTVIVPVPLHRRRHVSRGFNQAHELARVVARRIAAPLRTDLCCRVRATMAQSELKAGHRRHNVRDAFRVKPAPPSTVLLVDDVMTTGSTCNELAARFRSAGSDVVRVACVARA